MDTNIIVIIIVTIDRMLLSVNTMDPEIEDLVTPLKQFGERCGYESCSAIKEGWLNVHIVPHSHAELGYTNTFIQHFTGHDDYYDTSRINMKRILDATISELWADKERKFVLSDSEMPYFFHWWARRDGTVRRMVYQLIRQGRLVIVGGGWGMADEASTSYQSIIDSYTYSLRKINATFLTCGLPLVAWQSDTFGHSREYASLIALMGFDALFINPISFDDEVIRMERKGLEFVWRGSDDLGADTDIYSHKLFDGYWSPPGFCFGSLCADPLIITSDTFFSNVDERVELFIQHAVHRQAPHYNTRHVMMVMGQRLGYFDAKMWFENIDKLIKLVNTKTYERGDKIHLMYSTPTCYLDAVHRENPMLETKQDDFFPFAYDKHSYTSGMYTSRPTFKFLVRSSNIYLQIAKQLQVLTKLGNNDRLFEELMSINSMVQDHNVISGAMRPHVWSYYTEKIFIAIQKAAVLLEEAFNKIRGTPASTEYYLCNFNISSCVNTKVRSYHIIVYNPLAWPVTRPIRLPILLKKYAVFDPKGTKIQSVILRIPEHVLRIPGRYTPEKNELIFIAENIPPMGLRSYFIGEPTARRKRSLIKKLSKNQQKKYFIRQTRVDNKTLSDEIQDYDYLYDLEPGTKIEFGNISKLEDLKGLYKDYNLVIKPPSGTDKTMVPTEIRPTHTSSIETTTEFILKPTKTTVKELLTSTTASPTTISASPTSPSTEEIRTAPETTTKEARILTTRRERQTTLAKIKSVRTERYFYKESEDMFIKNKYIRIDIDNYRKVSSIRLSNKITTSLDIQYYFYTSDDPEKMKTNKKSPGVYIFRSIDVNPEPIIDFINTKVYKTDIVQEIRSSYSNYASFVLRLYKDTPFVEVDWTVGPVSVDDELGKEIFLRYTTDLENSGVFYTDANGRQTMKRIRHTRATYEPYNLDPIAGNFYPVTSRIYIEDENKNVRFSIFNDRSQGGSSLIEGTIDLMLHRRLTTEDSKIQAFLNETENGEGVIVRGTHYLYLTKANHKPNRIFEKKLAKEIDLKPQIVVSRIRQMMTKTRWLTFRNEFNALKSKLPVGVHILTIQEWNDGAILIRLENYLEKIDVVKSGIKKVYLKHLFVNLKPFKIVETTLSAHILLKDWTPLKWQTNGSFVKNFNQYYGKGGSVLYSHEVLRPFEEVDVNEAIILEPQQIRTFVVHYTYGV